MSGLETQRRKKIYHIREFINHLHVVNLKITAAPFAVFYAYFVVQFLPTHGPPISKHFFKTKIIIRDVTNCLKCESIHKRECIDFIAV